ncbi:MAG: HEPN domain-containing protein [Bacillota bacterium]
MQSQHEVEKTLALYRLAKAEECLLDAQNAVDNKRYSNAVNRSYYAIFHAVRALLALERFDSKRHSTIIGFFHKQFVGTGIVEKKYHMILTSAFHVRMETDYNDFFVLSIAAAEAQVLAATEFVKKISEMLKLDIE